MIYKKLQELQLSNPGMGCMRLPAVDGNHAAVCPQQTKSWEAVADFYSTLLCKETLL